MTFIFAACALDAGGRTPSSSIPSIRQQDNHMSRNPNTDPPQPEQQPELPPTPQPHDPLAPDPSQPEPLPLPPDAEPKSPVQEPDTPPPAGDPPTTDAPRMM
ncbi:MAG TPA: hypothetical protein VIQ24_05155 [Pyrinomonadaceae bacterium]